MYVSADYLDNVTEMIRVLSEARRASRVQPPERIELTSPNAESRGALVWSKGNCAYNYELPQG